MKRKQLICSLIFFDLPTERDLLYRAPSVRDLRLGGGGGELFHTLLVVEAALQSLAHLNVSLQMGKTAYIFTQRPRLIHLDNLFGCPESYDEKGSFFLVSMDLKKKKGRCNICGNNRFKKGTIFTLCNPLS